jgi:cytoskeletal protein CcmA (bactofilin family)
MFSFRRSGTVIAEGLKIVGSVAADGLVEVNGQVDGDLNCTSLIVSPKARIKGCVKAKQVVVNGKVEGPIRGGAVTLKSKAVVVGDIETQSLAIERGAYFEGRSIRANGSNAQLALSTMPPKEISDRRNVAPLADGATAIVGRAGPAPVALEDRAGPLVLGSEAISKKKVAQVS